MYGRKVKLRFFYIFIIFLILSLTIFLTLKSLEENVIYFQSPIGKGLIGKKRNDLVEIHTPAGIKNFEIIDVKYV